MKKQKRLSSPISIQRENEGSASMYREKTVIKIASKYQRFQRVSSVGEKNPLIGLTLEYENLPWSQVLYSPSNQ